MRLTNPSLTVHLLTTIKVKSQILISIHSGVTKYVFENVWHCVVVVVGVTVWCSKNQIRNLSVKSHALIANRSRYLFHFAVCFMAAGCLPACLPTFALRSPSFIRAPLRSPRTVIFVFIFRYCYVRWENRSAQFDGVYMSKWVSERVSG